MDEEISNSGETDRLKLEIELVNNLYEYMRRTIVNNWDTAAKENARKIVAQLLDTICKDMEDAIYPVRILIEEDLKTMLEDIPGNISPDMVESTLDTIDDHNETYLHPQKTKDTAGHYWEQW